MLTPDQRALLGVHCTDHPVAVCPQCSEALTFNQIRADIIMGKRDFCPMCRADLSIAVLRHLAECTAMRVQERETRQRARVIRSNSVASNGAPRLPIPNPPDDTRIAQLESEHLRERAQEAIGEAQQAGRDYIPIVPAHCHDNRAC
jgi:hypothetical protein